VEELVDGEVSPYLVEEVRTGERLELRGPIGGYFVWEAPTGGALLLVAGGSGIAPLMAMIRHRIAAGSLVPVKLLYSSRSDDDVIYRDELDRLSLEQCDIDVILARSAWSGLPPDRSGCP
jgi:ferredoxin-NADP reductase